MKSYLSMFSRSFMQYNYKLHTINFEAALLSNSQFVGGRKCEKKQERRKKRNEIIDRVRNEASETFILLLPKMT